MKSIQQEVCARDSKKKDFTFTPKGGPRKKPDDALRAKAVNLSDLLCLQVEAVDVKKTNERVE